MPVVSISERGGVNVRTKTLNISVWDVEAAAYRQVPVVVQGRRSITLAGETFEFFLHRTTTGWQATEVYSGSRIGHERRLRVEAGKAAFALLEIVGADTVKRMIVETVTRNGLANW